MIKSFIIYLSLFFVNILSAESAADILTNESVITDKFVKLEWSVSQQKFVSGDPIVGSMTVTNIGDVPIDLVLTNDFAFINPTVFQSEKPVDFTAYGSKMQDLQFITMHRMQFKLEQGKSYSISMRLSRFFDLSMGGKYQANSSLSYFPGSGDKWITLNSKPIQFNIVEIPATELLAPIKNR